MDLKHQITKGEIPPVPKEVMDEKIKFRLLGKEYIPCITYNHWERKFTVWIFRNENMLENSYTSVVR